MLDTDLGAEARKTGNFPLWGMMPPGTEPYALIDGLREGDPVFFAPNTHNSGAGTWIVTRFDHIKNLYMRTAELTVEGQTGLGALLGDDLRMVPTEADAPAHASYRGILGPFFSNGPLDALEPSLTALSLELIDRIKGDGSCEFMATYARQFPVGAFLRLMGLPVSDIDMLNHYATTLTYSPDMQQKRWAMISIRDYLVDQIKLAEAGPRDDFISKIVQSEINGRPLTGEEKFALCLNLFVGGMDTVSASLGWHFRYLAMDGGLQARLRADRSLIPNAVEELLRTYSVVSSSRRALTDIEIGGATIRKGDFITVGTELANRDPAKFENPHEVNIDRSPNRHIAFGFGMHHCLGAPLARRELRIAINSWFDSLPPFRLVGKSTDGMPTWTGSIFSLESLHLSWS